MNDTPEKLLNCWEFTKCGRELGGANVAELGVCPAVTEQRLDGIYGGCCAGRACWLVAGTHCLGRVQGTFAQRHHACMSCKFYDLVKAENPQAFATSENLLAYLAASEAEEIVRYSRVLRSMVDPSVLEVALCDLDKLARGEQRRITAFFSDVVGFSVIIDDLEEGTVRAFLNEYLSEMTAILKREGGTLDKYIGDAVVGIFGAPVRLESTSLNAGRSALAMQARLSELKACWQRDRRWSAKAWNMGIRIGLCTGQAEVGLMGTRALASYSMLGSTVNRAKCLENACKYYGLDILVCEETRREMNDSMVLRAIDRIKVKGSSSLATVYQLMGKKGQIPDHVLESINYYERALHNYEQGNWMGAERLFLLSRATWGQQALLIDRLILRCVENRLCVAGKELDPYPVGGAVNLEWSTTTIPSQT